MTVFFSILQHGQDDDCAIILTRRQDSAVVLVSFLVCHFINANGAQVLYFVPVDLLVHLPLQRTQNGIVAQVFLEADIRHGAANE